MTMTTRWPNGSAVAMLRGLLYAVPVEVYEPGLGGCMWVRWFLDEDAVYVVSANLLTPVTPLARALLATARTR